MELPVLAARVDAGREFREQAAIEGPAREGAIQAGRVDQLLLVKPDGRTPRLWLPYEEVTIGLGNNGRVRLSDEVAYLAELEHISGPDATSLIESVRAHLLGQD